MRNFTDGVGGETLEQEREALRLDMRHLQEQCRMYGCENGSTDLGGVKGMLLREKGRLFEIYHAM